MSIQEGSGPILTDAWGNELHEEAMSNFENYPKRLRDAVKHSIIKGDGNDPKNADQTIHRVFITEQQSQYKK